MSLKKIVLGTLAGMVLTGTFLLSGCTSIIIDRDHTKQTIIRRFTETSPDKSITKTTLDYDIEDLAPFTDPNKHFKIKKIKEVKHITEYWLERFEEIEVLCAKKGSNNLDKVIEWVPKYKENWIKNTADEHKTKETSEGPYENPASYIWIHARNMGDNEVGFEDDNGYRQKELRKRTDANGEIKFKLVSLINNRDFVIFCRNNKSKEKLINKIKNHWIVKGIKEPLKSRILPSIEKLIKDSDMKSIQFDTYDNEKSSSDSYIHHDQYNDTYERIENKKTVNDKAYGFGMIIKYIDYDKVLNEIIKKNIDYYINSEIKTAEIKIRDDASHIGIPKAKLEMKIEAPSKRDLADDYFTGKLLEWAVEQIKDYKKGDTTIYTNNSGTAVLSVYVPSKFKTEITHPKYHYVPGSGELNNKTLDKYIADMIELGSKVRITDDERKEGRLRIDK